MSRNLCKVEFQLGDSPHDMLPIELSIQIFSIESHLGFVEIQQDDELSEKSRLH